MIKTGAIILGAALALQAQDNSAKRVDEAKFVISHGAGETFQFVGGQLLDSNPVKGQPYSAEAVNESTQTLPDGNRIVNRNSSMLYRDSEGRERREESIGKLGAWSAADGAPAKIIFISDPVAKAAYSLDEKSHTATKMPAPMVTATATATGKGMQTFAFSRSAGPVTGAGPAGGGAVFGYEARVTIGHAAENKSAKVEKLGSQTIEGVVAEGTRTTVTIPAGQIGNERDINIVDERWFSPELQVTVRSKHSDPRMGETTYTLTNINRTEPARTLFEVPQDYSVSDLPQVRRMVTKDDNQ